MVQGIPNLTMRKYLGLIALGARMCLLGGMGPAASGQQPPAQRSGGGRTLHVWKESPRPTPPYPDKLRAAHKVQDALDLAQPGDTVLVHGDCVKSDGRCLYQENLSVPCGVTLRGDGTLPAIPILDGGGQGRVITGQGARCPPDQVTTVLRFEIQNGRTSNRGAGIYFPNRLTRIIENCCHDNQAAIGGCISIHLEGNSLPRPVVVIERNLIEKNRATRSGGGVSIEGVYLNPGRIDDWHVDFNENTVRENEVKADVKVAWGGGLEVFRARVHARNNLFEGNTVLGDVESYGGHVAVMNEDENTLFKAGWALFDRGAGGWSRDVSELEPEQYFSEANIYRQGGRKGTEILRGGGAIAVTWNASVRLRGDWAYQNQANTGGAIYTNARSLLEIDNSHLERNVAHGDGGAGYIVCGSRVRLQGGNLLENNQAQGRNPVGGPRHTGSPTLYPRGGGGLYVRNARAELRRTNVIRKNLAQGLFEKTVGTGGGLFLWQVDKALLFPGQGLRDQLEGVICNRTTRLTIEGNNLFEENTAQHEGGGIAILLEADDPAAFQRLAGSVLRLERSFARSYLVEGTQLRNNRAWPGDPGAHTPGAGGLYYHEHFAPEVGAQPADSQWAQGTTLIRGVLFESNQGWGIKVVDTGMHLRSPDGRMQWIQSTVELQDSLIQANSAGGLHLRRSWPRVVGNHFVGNQEKQVEIDNDLYTRPHLPIFTENHLDGFRRSRVGVFATNAPGTVPSPGWSNRLESNNLIDHTESAAVLATTTNVLLMPRNWWGPNGPIPAGNNPPTPPNSVSGYILTDPPLTAPVEVPVDEFPRITVNPRHPTEPPIPPCPGIVPEPGIPTEPPGIPPEPPRHPPNEPPGKPPERTPGQPMPPPGEPVPTPGHPPQQPVPPPGQPIPTPGHPPPEQPEPESGWSFSVPANQIVRSTLSAKNFCRRRHRFQITADDLPFLRLLEKPNFQVSPGQTHTVPVEINAAGLAPGEYRGTVVIQCQTCSKEPTCAQDRSVLPIRMTVLPPAR